MADLMERARKHLGRPETRQLMNELADRIAALEAEAPKGERRGLERAIALVEDNRLADRGNGPSYASVHNKACTRIANGLRRLIPEAPVREAE